MNSNCEAGKFGEEAQEAASEYRIDRSAVFLGGVNWCLKRLIKEMEVNQGLHIAYGGSSFDKEWIQVENQKDWLQNRLKELEVSIHGGA